MEKLKLALHLKYFCILTISLSAFLAMANDGPAKGKLSEVHKKKGVQHFLFPDTSMTPAILPGESVSIDFDYYSKSSVKRGDVVAVSQPDLVQGIYVSRVIGLPTETISCKEDSFFINHREAHRKKIDEKQCDSIVSNISSGLQERSKQISCFEESLDGFKHIVLLGRYPSENDGNATNVPVNNYYLEKDNRFYFLGSHETAVVNRNQIVGKVLTFGK